MSVTGYIRLNLRAVTGGDDVAKLRALKEDIFNVACTTGKLAIFHKDEDEVHVLMSNSEWKFATGAENCRKNVYPRFFSKLKCFNREPFAPGKYPFANIRKFYDDDSQTFATVAESFYLDLGFNFIASRDVFSSEKLDELKAARKKAQEAADVREQEEEWAIEEAEERKEEERKRKQARLEEMMPDKLWERFINESNEVHRNIRVLTKRTFYPHKRQDLRDLIEEAAPHYCPRDLKTARWVRQCRKEGDDSWAAFEKFKKSMEEGKYS